MPVLRKKLTENYTVIPNSLVNADISLRALGLAVWMLSKPQDWKFSKKAIENAFPKNGHSSIQSAVDELKAAGYLEIYKDRNAQGQLSGYVWTVMDVPAGDRKSKNRATENGLNTKYLKDKTLKRDAVPSLGAGEQRSEYRYSPELGAYVRANEEGRSVV